MEESLKKSEERLKKAQSMGKIGNWEFDVVTGKIDWSDEVYNIYERDRKLGPPTAEEECRYYPPEETGKLREFAKLAIEKSQEFNYELTAKLPSGKTIFLSSSMTPVKDKNGRVTKLFGTVQDITEHKQLEEQLFRAQKMEGIGKFSGYIAHDFNNIISVISGYAGMILEDLPPDSPLRKDIEQIKKAGERATGLTRQLLAFSRKQILQKQVGNLNTLFLDMEKMLHRLIGEDIKLTVNIEPELAKVNIDPGQIEQVFMNLVINARDAMPEGGEITIRAKNIIFDEWSTKTTPEARADKFVCLSIQDTGTGMDKEILSRLFEPFFTTKAEGRGTGLGLPVCYGIVKQHEGWINVYSEKGKGTIFNVYLPAITSPIEEADKETNVVINEAKGNGERILLIEDQPELNLFVTHILTKNGYAVSSAGTAEESFEIFEKENHNFDVLFTDSVLPDSTGMHIAEKLLALKPDLKVIFTSGYTDEKSQRLIMEEKRFKFLQKPYPTNVLLQTIKEAIQK
jgi:signal transduction histidine kinase/CheY-like chemotaxis protein